MYRYCTLWIIRILLILAPTLAFGAGGGGHSYEGEPFPTPLTEYGDGHIQDVLEVLKARIKAEPFNLVATIIFLCAIIHTFMTGFFMKIAHKMEHEHEEQIKREGRTADQRKKKYRGAVDDVSFWGKAFHFLGEIEAVFGMWAIALAGAIIYFHDWGTMVHYLGSTVNYTEPMFVVIIMAIAATRPILQFSETIMGYIAKMLGGSMFAWWFTILTIGPILGSFITEPAAMTIAAMLLGRKFYQHKPKATFAYATLGLLFVNISVGGTLTHFAAPPVLMVAAPWGWDMGFMAMNFGWKAVVGIFISNVLYYLIFKGEFKRMAEAHATPKEAVTNTDKSSENYSDYLDKEDKLDEKSRTDWKDRQYPVPFYVTAVHLLFLAWTVLMAHYPPLFMAGFMFFLGFTQLTAHHQNAVNLKAPVLVGFFLGGLVIHGGCQGWWIAPVLSSMGEIPLMVGAIVMTAFNDNAAITYLATLVPSFSETMKYFVVAGAVTGGGLTVIANAPNPAGQNILNRYFPNGVGPGGLFLGALIPTVIMTACFIFLGTPEVKEEDQADYGAKVEQVEDAHHGHDHGDHSH